MSDHEIIQEHAEDFVERVSASPDVAKRHLTAFIKEMAQHQGQVVIEPRELAELYVDAALRKIWGDGAR